MNVRVRQALFVAVGLVAASVMSVLGVWQMQRSVDSGAAGIRARAAEAATPLLDSVRADGTVGDVYGKPVTVSGRYLADQELLVPDTAGGVRVLTAFQVADGRVVPVVRGRVDAGTAPSPAPGGTRTEAGLFLPGEGDPDVAPPAGRLGSVRMPLLAQLWTQQLTPGFVTLDAEHAAAQGLAAASVSLPAGEKSLQNGSYAIQWWIFAAFALGMGLKLAHDAGERERRRAEAAVEDSGAAATVATTRPGERAAREDDEA